jgi:hypothetical protein
MDAAVRKKALVFLDYDMLVRHFVLSGAFRELERTWQVKYIFLADATSQKTPLTVEPSRLGLSDWTYFEMPRRRMGSWDKLYCVTALRNQRGTSNYGWRKALMASVRGKARVRWYELLSLPGAFQLFRRRFLDQMGTYQPLDDFIAKEAPDVVFHPSILAGYFINELLEICPRQGIPLAVLMNSWDNPSTKAMNTGLPDRLVVWGPQTRRHAIEYMRMPPERVLQFGAAQFDVYRDPVTKTDAELRGLFNVPADVPIVLYAGVSKSVDETAHLRTLEAAIAEGRVPKCHILYRPHPWRGGLVQGETNFFDVTWRHVSMDPAMEAYYRRTAVKSEQGFDMADYRVTVKLLRLVAGVISPLSTMLLEAIMLGKPVLMFVPGEDQSEGVQDAIKLGMKLPHFAEFWGKPGIAICTRPADLAPSLLTMLTEHQSAAVRDSLIAHGRDYAVMDGPRYPQRLAALAEELATVAATSPAAPQSRGVPEAAEASA